MKIAQNLAIISSIVLVAGCSSWRDRHAQTENYHYSSAHYGAYGDVGGNMSSTYARPSSSFETNNPSYQPGTSSSTSSAQTGTTVVSQVQQQLSQDPNLATLVPSLQITAQGGTVTLNGTVSSEQDKQKVEDTARRAPGVATVNNQLQVFNQPQSNLPINTENKTALGGTSDQSSTNTSSAIQSGQDTAAQQSSTTERSSAEQAALAQSHDTTNTNTDNLQNKELTPTSDNATTSRVYGTNQAPTITATSDADRTLGQQITQELKNDASMTAALAMIKLNIENGKVTLSGTATSEDQKKKIESAVQRVTGVSSVEDQIQVGDAGADTGITPIKQ